MSSFLVQPETIHRIVTFLDLHGSSPRITDYRITRLLEKYNLDVGDHAFTENLSKDLLELNLHALNERYGERTGIEDKAFAVSKGAKYEFQMRVARPIQVLKSVECLSYQCAEGDTVERPLFKFLEELEDAIATFIVHSMTEYEKADWD